MKKKIYVFILAAAIVLGTTVPAFGESYKGKESYVPVNVTLDGKDTFWESGSPRLVEGITYVPLREFCSYMGEFTLIWSEETHSANVKSTGLDITAREGLPYIVVNDRVFFGGRVFISNGVLYVPIRAIAKAYGTPVEWEVREGKGVVKLTQTGVRAEKAENVYDSEVLYWLSRIISAESRGESLTGQIAVGNVVLNRVRNEQFPNSVYDVIFDTRFGVQFTPISNGTIYTTPAESSVVAAKICLEGYTLSDNIYYFLNKSAATSLWVHNNRPYVMTIGAHSFYS